MNKNFGSGRGTFQAPRYNRKINRVHLHPIFSILVSLLWLPEWYELGIGMDDLRSNRNILLHLGYPITVVLYLIKHFNCFSYLIN